MTETQTHPIGSEQEVPLPVRGKDPPERGFVVGRAVQLVDILTLATQLNISRAAATSTLVQLKVPLVYIGEDIFFSIHALEKALFFVSRYGGRGFMAPGSLGKRKLQYRRKKRIEPVKITDEDIEGAPWPRIEREMERITIYRQRAVEKIVSKAVRSEVGRLRGGFPRRTADREASAQPAGSPGSDPGQESPSSSSGQ